MHNIATSQSSNYFVGNMLIRHNPGQAASLYMYPGDYWTSNFIKGELLERSTHRIINSGFLDRNSTDWNLLTPHRVGRAGIDSLFIKIDSQNRLRDLMIVEAKFGTSKLGMTRDGQQMSASWTKPRIARTAQQYRQIATELKTGVISWNSTGSDRSIALPVRRGEVAYISHTGKRLCVQGSSGNMGRAMLAKQANRIASFLDAVSADSISSRSRVIHLSGKGDIWSFGLDKLDSTSGRTLGQTVIKGRFSELPPQVRGLLKNQLIALIEEKYGLPPDETRIIAEKICSNPRLLSDLQTTPKMSWKIGIDIGMFNAAAGAAAIAVLLELGRSVISSKHVDFKRLTKVGMASAGSAALGYYVGSQVYSRLLTTATGQRIASLLPLRNAAGSTVGGVAALGAGVASALGFALIGYLTGLLTEREAKITAVAGVAGAAGGVLFTTGLLGAATSFGVAGTGVPIAQLTGIAATKAGLAWLGGGTVASGGTGVAGGSAILSGGSALVVIAVAGVVCVAKSKIIDAITRERLVVRHLAMVEEKFRA